MRVTPAVALLLAIAAVSAVAMPAGAHALVDRSDPGAYRVLLKAPEQVVLHFSEPVDPNRTEIRVLDPEGRRVDRRASSFAPDRKRATVSVRLPGPGIYTVTWRTLSAFDRHPYEGFFTFTVGPLRLGSYTLKGGIPTGPSPWEVAARWLMFVGGVVLAGGGLAHRFLLSSAVSSPGLQEGSVWLPALNRRWRIAAWVGTAGFLVGTLAELGSQAVQAAEAAGEDLGTALAQLALAEPTRTSLLLKITAPLVLVRLLRDSLAPGPVVGLVGSGPTRHVVAAAEVIFASLPLLGISLTSHAAVRGPVPLITDWLHLVSAAAWVGGLIYLAAVLTPALGPKAGPRQSQLLGLFAQWFSNVAVLSVSVLVVTGLYAAWVHVPSLGAVRSTAYGWTLAVKMALLVPLLTIAAVNLLVLRPRLARAASQGMSASRAPVDQRRFFSLTRSEAVLTCIVLLAAATLALLPTARQVQALAPGPLTLARRAGEVDGVLRIKPYQVGNNSFELRLRNLRSTLPIPDARVRFTFLPLATGLGAAVAEATPQGDGRYLVKGGHIAAKGPWLVTVTVRMRGEGDLQLSYPIEPDWERATAITPPTDAEALALLRQADEAMNRLRSARQRQEIGDGSGNVVVTLFDFAAPDAMHYRVVGGAEAIVIGDTQYVNEGAGWSQAQSPAPFKFPHSTFSTSASHVVFGPREIVDGVPTQTVVFILTVGSARARYAVWIDEQSHRIVQEAMVARSHYMTTRNYDFDDPGTVRIRAPSY